eukprot:NODE_464_length_7114_cov_0.303350.p4 type:complete len:196 gc:universal NODE_464_length_7114_cov_0.303350:2352-2939(+)
MLILNVLFAISQAPIVALKDTNTTDPTTTDPSTDPSTDTGDSSGGPGVARFSSPQSDWKSQQNIPLSANLKVEWSFTDALTNAPDKMTLELEVPFTSPIQYIVINDKISKGTTTYNWKPSKDLTPQKGYRLLLRRTQNDGEDRAKTLQAGFGQLTPSYSPRFTLYVSKDYSPDPSTEASASTLFAYFAFLWIHFQ